MSDHVVLLSVPGLRATDLPEMPYLSRLVAQGDHAPLVPSFPCVTWPVQTNMLTGKLPNEHGVIANGFYWRSDERVEMWTAGNEAILEPQIWDVLHQHNADLKSAAWFPMLSKRSGADYVCMPAPVHNPDGSESLWCYTKPTDFYGELMAELDHFPLQHFWGPLANIKSTAWIINSAIVAVRQYQPHFFYVYLPHLDYAAQKDGPDSPNAQKAVRDLDKVLGTLIEGFQTAYESAQLLWLVASEYVITPVNHVTYPNRILREAGLLQVKREQDSEQLDFANSKAWALVDHQFSQVFVRDGDAMTVKRVCQLFANKEGIAQCLVGDELSAHGIDHDRCGDVVLVSTAESWQAYYWWHEDAVVPTYARTVDIHRKPGYDPVELHFDPATKSIPLDATLVRGSHGAPAVDDSQRGVLLSSQKGVFVERETADTDVADIVLRQFGI